MDNNEDAFGQMLWNYYNGNQVFETIERDDGLKNELNPATYFSSYKNWQPTEKKAMDFVKGKVLDIGCGAGRHSLHLQEKGFEVVGIDVSPLAIKVCKLRGLKQARVMPVENLDFKEKSFDTIIMMGNNFGLLGSLGKAQKVLERFYEITTKNAVVIAGIRDPYKTDDLKHLAYHELNKKKGRMGGQVRIRTRFQEHVSPWFDYLMVSKQEMVQVLEGTGWSIQQFIDSKTNYVTLIEKN
jgi:SAM-dependent methyltransferase